MMSEINGRIDEAIRTIQKTYNIPEFTMLEVIESFGKAWRLELRKKAANSIIAEVNDTCDKDIILYHLDFLKDS